MDFCGLFESRIWSSAIHASPVASILNVRPRPRWSALCKTKRALSVPAVLKEAGGLVDVDYTSPLNKPQRAEEGLAIVHPIESATTLAQVNPTIMFNFDGNAIVRELAEINGVAEKLLRPVAEVLRDIEIHEIIQIIQERHDEIKKH